MAKTQYTAKVYKIGEKWAADLYDGGWPEGMAAKPEIYYEFDSEEHIVKNLLEGFNTSDYILKAEDITRGEDRPTDEEIRNAAE